MRLRTEKFTMLTRIKIEIGNGQTGQWDRKRQRETKKKTECENIFAAVKSTNIQFPEY